MIKICAALLLASTQLTPLKPVPVNLSTAAPPAEALACAREYDDLPLSGAVNAPRGQRTSLTVDVVDRYLEHYARQYRATVASTPALVRPLTTKSERSQHAQQDRITFLLLMVSLDSFDHYYVDLSHPAYGACLRTHIVTELEKLPPGGTYELSPAAVINMFNVKSVLSGPWPMSGFAPAK